MSIRDDLNKLYFSDKKGNQLPFEKQPESIKSLVGFSSFPDAIPQSTSAIASPLTEKSRVEVNFQVFDDFNVWSVIEKHITQITMTDANSNEVVFNFKDPNIP